MESKPVFELHKLSEGYIVTSDEEILPNTLYMNNGVLFTSDSVYDEGNNPNNSNPKVTNHNFKVIAQQDQIDFSALKEEEQKEIGWFDTVKFAREEHKFNHKSVHEMSFVLGVEIGFQKAQELLSDRRFSLEDMFKVLDLMKHIAKTSSNLAVMEVEGRRLIESLSQKSWKVEIQHVCEGVKKEGESCTLNNKCTYPNCGKIKILKLC
jgi:hypothetical protein